MALLDSPPELGSIGVAEHRGIVEPQVIPAGPYERLARRWIDNDTLLYHSLPDRHLRGDGNMDLNGANRPIRCGGDIPGITGDLNRIQDMGYDAVWIGPIAENLPDDEDEQSFHYHLYHPIAFDRIDPQLGDDSDLRELTTQAHRRGMRVVIDFVPNHCSNKHPAFLKATGQMPLEEGDPADGYRSWFRFDPKTGKPMTFLGYGDLIKLNLDTPEVIEHLQGAMRKWIGLGVDGFRIDHIIGLSNRNVDDLFKPLKKEFPGLALIGEAWMGEDGCMVNWHDLTTIRVARKRLIWTLGRLGLDEAGSTLLYRNYKDRLDGVLDFTASKMLEKYATAQNAGEKEKVKHRLVRWSNKFRGKLLQVVFADNHDKPRAMYQYGDDPDVFIDTLELAYSLGTPIANYCGTEYGATQEGPFGDWHGDLKAREPLPLIQAAHNPQLHSRFKQIVRESRHRRKVETIGDRVA